MALMYSGDLHPQNAKPKTRISQLPDFAPYNYLIVFRLLFFVKTFDVVGCLDMLVDGIDDGCIHY